MARSLLVLFCIALCVSPFYSKSQTKSLAISASGGVNRYFGLTAEPSHPQTEYDFGKAFTVELSFISGIHYLPNRFACGIVMDYYEGTFREFGEGFNQFEYLKGNASKFMVGGYLVPFVFDYDEVLYIKPGVEWSYQFATEVDGYIRSNQLPNFGEEVDLTNEFSKNSDFGVALTVEYVFKVSRRCWIAPRYKAYCSLQDVLEEMKSFRNTIGVSFGVRLHERLNDYNRLP